MAMKLEGKIEALIDFIVEGKTFRQIAKVMGCSISTLHYFLALPEHSARTNAALALSAAQYADKAEDVLIECQSTMTEVTRAKELSQYYRWKAKMRDPKKYGDKIDVDLGVPPGTEIIIKGQKFADND